MACVDHSVGHLDGDVGQNGIASMLGAAGSCCRLGELTPFLGWNIHVAIAKVGDQVIFMPKERVLDYLKLVFQDILKDDRSPENDGDELVFGIDMVINRHKHT